MSSPCDFRLEMRSGLLFYQWRNNGHCWYSATSIHQYVTIGCPCSQWTWRGYVGRWYINVVKDSWQSEFRCQAGAELISMMYWQRKMEERWMWCHRTGCHNKAEQRLTSYYIQAKIGFRVRMIIGESKVTMAVRTSQLKIGLQITHRSIRICEVAWNYAQYEHSNQQVEALVW